MTDQKKIKNKVIKPKQIEGINLPKEDIKVEKGHQTFLPTLKRIVTKKKKN